MIHLSQIMLLSKDIIKIFKIKQFGCYNVFLWASIMLIG